ncbi:UNVERIFIED_CONTAM: hypothetical protein HDU68_007644 [Siphonaria sp. JEL0065]|nr:hypothetical protein HDU68_007644 [Siphonaria sp. JEL0065]
MRQSQSLRGMISPCLLLSCAVSVLGSTFPESLTIGLIGPFAKLPNVQLDGYLVVSDVFTLDNANNFLYVYDDISFFWWNDAGVEVAVHIFNKNATIFPNTTIKIKRFNDFDPRFIDQGGDSSGYAIQVALDIQQNHPDVVAIFGGLNTGTALKTGEIYKLPYCTAFQQSSHFTDRNLYPNYISMMSNSGMAEAFCLTLKKWNVKQVGLITSTGSSEIIAGFHACGVRILTLSKITTSVTIPEVKEIGKLLKYYDVRYVILDSDPATSGTVYFTLATMNITMGKGYVWLGTNYPYPVDNGVEVGENPKAPNFVHAFNEYVDTFNSLNDTDPLNGMSAFDCIGVLANGFNGFTGHPLQIMKGGDLREPYLMYQFDKKYYIYQAASTDFDRTNITYSTRFPPKFNGNLTSPPPDGLVYTDSVISNTSGLGYFVLFMIFSGLIFCGLDATTILMFRKEGCIRAGSINFSLMTLFGSALGFISAYFGLGMPTYFICVAERWTSSIGFSIVASALVIKNMRIGIIFNSKTSLPKIFLKDAFVMFVAWVLVGIEALLLGLWTRVSKISVGAKQMDHTLTMEYMCINAAQAGKTIEEVLIAYNILLMLAAVAVTYFTRGVKATHSEVSYLTLIITSTVLFTSINWLLSATSDSPMMVRFTKPLLTWLILIQVVLLKFGSRVVDLIANAKFDIGRLSFASNSRLGRKSTQTRSNTGTTTMTGNQSVSLAKRKSISHGSSGKMVKMPAKGFSLIYQDVAVGAKWVQSKCIMCRFRKNCFVVFVPKDANEGVVKSISVEKTVTECRLLRSEEESVPPRVLITQLKGGKKTVVEFATPEGARTFLEDIAGSQF